MSLGRFTLVIGSLLGLAGSACATGPHPALAVAAKDFKCEQKELQLHKIYPKMVRIDGCGKEGTYVEVCSGYGLDSDCHWAKKAE